MLVTNYSFMMAVLCSCVLLLIGAILTRSKKFVLRYGISGFLFFFTAGVLRLAFPVEFSFNKIIHDNYVIPALVRWVRVPVLNAFGVSQNVGQLILLAWATGMVVYLVIFFIGIARQNKAVSRIESLPAGQYSRIMDEIVSATPKHQKYTLLVTSGISSPVMAGLVKPVIIMPDFDLSDEQARYILLHEWYHYLNGDLWKKFLCNILCAVFWWNPLMYIIKARLNYILEINCDNHVVKGRSSDERINYVETTLEVMKRSTSAGFRAGSGEVAFAEAAGKSAVVDRCELVLYPPKNPGAAIKAMSFALVAVIIALSYIYIIQPYADAPALGTGEGEYIDINPDNAYLTPNADGSFALYVNGSFLCNVSADQMNSLPFTELKIK